MADTGRLDELKRKFDDNPRRYFAPLANEYRKAGQADVAIELCRTYLPQQPTHMSGYIVYAQSLQDAGQIEESAAVFKQALSLDPENIIALRNLGDIARDAGDSAGAMRWYGKVLEMDPRNEEIAAYINSIASPGSQPTPPAPERQAPPTIRPEPEPDASAVRLEDIFSEPDMVQMPIVADGPAADVYDPSPDQVTDEPFEVTQWPSAMESESAPDQSSVLEGPWHASAPESEEVPVEQSVEHPAEKPADQSSDAFSEPDSVADENQLATQEPAAPLRLSDYMPEEDAAFAPTAEELPEQLRPEVGDTAPARLAANDAPPTPAADSSPFVTETMAELYMQQGLRGEALTIYRQLALKRDDPALHKRIAEIEAGESGKSSGETVRAFFARIGARRPNERVVIAADSNLSLAALFGSAQADPGDVTAAQRLSGAFGAGDQRSADSQS